ncbi:MAG: hypothetical protein ACTHOH_02470 [Lysobacteraceae bacterium]
MTGTPMALDAASTWPHGAKVRLLFAKRRVACPGYRIEGSDDDRCAGMCR